MSSSVGEDLAEIVRGNARRLVAVSRTSPSKLSTSSMSVEFVLGPAAIMRVIQEWLRDDLDDWCVQRWASFVRRGYLETNEQVACAPIKIEFAAEHEDTISAIITRLDELGDSIDGVVTDAEKRDMVATLERLIE
ncbi:MAG: hypothetical protein AAFV36_08725 [Myxococcota bacterium]